MANIIWSDVEAIAPELATMPEVAQTAILAYVNNALAVAEFGGETDPRTRLARIYLAAHFGVMASQRGVAISGESEGGLSRQYALGDTDLSSTLHGRMFAMLARTTRNRVVVL